MAIIIYPGSTYPTALDSFLPRVTDGLDDVMQSHCNSHSEAIEFLEAKLGIDGSPVTGLGGASFDSAGKAANPGGPGIPTIWIDNTTGVNYDIKYTDNAGSTFSLLGGLWSDVAGELTPATAGKGLAINAASNYVSLDSDDYSLLDSSGTGFSAAYGTVVRATGGKLLVTTTGASNDIEITSVAADVNISSATGFDVTDAVGGSITLGASGATINAGALDFDTLSRDVDISATRNITILFDTNDTTGETFIIRHGSVPTDLARFVSGGSITFTPDTNYDFVVTTAGTLGDVLLEGAGGYIKFLDNFKSGSTYSTAHLPLSAATAEWNTFVTNFGDGTSILSAINTAYSAGGGGSTSTSLESGASMYSSSRGDFSVTYVSTTQATLSGLPFNISASNIAAIIRKPTGTATSIQRTRGVDLDCSWTNSGSVIGSGTITMSAPWFVATDEIEVLVEGPNKAYDVTSNANRSILTNPDSLRNSFDDEINQSGLTGPGSYDYYYDMSIGGFHRLSMVVKSIADVTITVYGTNRLPDKEFGLSSADWEDITLLALGADTVTSTGAYYSLDSIPFARIWIEFDYADATGDGEYDVSITTSAI